MSRFPALFLMIVFNINLSLKAAEAPGSPEGRGERYKKRVTFTGIKDEEKKMPISPVKKPSPSFVQSFEAAYSIDQLPDLSTEDAKALVQTFISTRLRNLIYVANGPLNPYPKKFKTYRFLKRLLPFSEARAVYAEKMSPIINGWFEQDADYQDKVSFIWECRKYDDLDSRIVEIFNSSFLNQLPRSILKGTDIVTMADLKRIVQERGSDLVPIAYVENLLEQDFEEFNKCINLEEYDAFLGEEKSENIAIAFTMIYHLHLNHQLIFSERLSSLLPSLSKIIINQQNPGYFTKCILDLAKVWLVLLQYDGSADVLRNIEGHKILIEKILTTWAALKRVRHPFTMQPIPSLQTFLEEMVNSLNLRPKGV